MAVTDSATALPTVEAEMNFTVRSAEKPKVIMSVDQAQPNKRTGEYALTRVPIADARALSQAPQLDREGFELITSRTKVTDFYDEQQIKDIYYPEVIALLKAETGATDVHIFDHTLRVQDDKKRTEQGTRLPVPIVHNDYTEWSGPQRVRDVLEPEKSQRYLSGRFSMVNVWRSFGESAERFPLAAADGRTMTEDDYIGVDMVYSDRVGEIYQNAYSDAQRWYYFSNMTPDEAILLKCFDTARDGRTRYTAHSGFENASAPAGTPPRESIEVRTLLSFA